MSSRQVKIVLLGDNGVGKTSVIQKFLRKRVGNLTTRSLLLEAHEVTVLLHDEPVDVKIIDVGNCDSSNFQKGHFNDVDVFILCYSVVQPKTFDNIRHWRTEIDHLVTKKGIPFVLCGTKLDFKGNEKIVSDLRAAELEPISDCRALRFCNELDGMMSIQVSCYNVKLVDVLFAKAIELGLKCQVERQVVVFRAQNKRTKSLSQELESWESGSDSHREELCEWSEEKPATPVNIRTLGRITNLTKKNTRKSRGKSFTTLVTKSGVFGCCFQAPSVVCDYHSDNNFDCSGNCHQNVQ